MVIEYQQVLEDAKYPPQGFRSCLGILNLEKSYRSTITSRCAKAAPLQRALATAHPRSAHQGEAAYARHRRGAPRSRLPRALSYRLCSYRRIQNMLKLGLEEEQEQQPLSFPSHDNVRGSHYYN